MNKPLEELAIITYGKDYKPNPSGDNVPIYGTGGLMGYTSKKMNSGPAILTGRKGSINKPFYLEGDFWNVDTIFCIKAKPGVNTKWLFYNLKNTDLNKLNEATGVPSVNTQSLYRLKFNYFSPVKQDKIAQILTTCDTVIEKTEATIAKYQAMKQGLMHDLFTRGIDIKTGKLRPKQEDAPELYKESELGWIPKEWDDTTFGKVIIKSLYGPRFNANNYNLNGNVKTIRGTDFSKEGSILYNQTPIALISKDKIQAHILKSGDVIMVTTADCGLTAVFEEQGFNFIPSAYSVKFRFIEIVEPYFIKYFMQTNFAIKQVNKYIRQGTIGNLPGSDVLTFLITIPSKIEQRKILDNIKSLISKIETEQSYLSKYQKLKTGLMQDLLTGKVEVKV
ncbi:MAG: restriction endonuclease subunit S [Chryseobacterium jejuense]|uniref:restriction endonuclease subunit S n=1 Tax=Chryseobacterium jejuense TaxID=445960 RepID=UPI003D1517C1